MPRNVSVLAYDSVEYVESGLRKRATVVVMRRSEFEVSARREEDEKIPQKWNLKKGGAERGSLFGIRRPANI